MIYTNNYCMTCTKLYHDVIYIIMSSIPWIDFICYEKMLNFLKWIVWNCYNLRSLGPVISLITLFWEFFGLPIATVCFFVCTNFKDLLPGGWYPGIPKWTLSLFDLLLFLLSKFDNVKHKHSFTTFIL